MQRFVTSGKAWRAFGLMGALIVVLYFFPLSTALETLFLPAVGIITTIALIVGYLVWRPTPRVAWLLLLLAQVFNSLGDVLSRLFISPSSGSLVQGIPGALYLIANLLLLAGAIALFVHFRYLIRRDTIPQGLIIGMGFGLLAWVVIYPNLTAEQLASGWFENLLYPAAIVVVAFVSSLFLLTPLGTAWSFRFMFGVLLFQQLASYTYNDLAHLFPAGIAVPYGVSNPSDVLSVCALVFLGMAYLHPSFGVLNKLKPQRVPGLSGLEMVTLALAFSVAPVALMIQTATQLPLNIFVLLVGMLIVFGLIEWRLAILLGVLETQNEQLRSLDKLKNQFLANMTHELRTPLNSIINFSHFTGTGMYGEVNEQQRMAMERVSDSGTHLLAMINDVLDLAKIQADMVKLFVERDVSLNDELDSALSMVQGLLADKPVELVQQVPPDLPLMVGDRRRIRQIFINLLSNACKFTDRGQVRLEAAQQDGHVLVQVHDTGPGIDPQDIALVFEPFRQSQAGLEHGGTGLGLPIASSFVQAHYGRIWFESKVNEGTTFYVSLPIHAPELEKIAQV